MDKNKPLRLIIADDGVGFDPKNLPQPNGRRGWGMLTMSERADAVGAKCHVESHPHQGTTVIVEVER